MRYFAFLKHVPLAAWVADALMYIGYGIFKRDILLTIDRIESEVSKWDGINVTLHKFGGRQFNYHNREIGHVHSNGILDIPFNRTCKMILLEKGMTSDHHVFPNSGWVSFYIRQESDGVRALQLLQLAYSKTRQRGLRDDKFESLRALNGPLENRAAL